MQTAVNCCAALHVATLPIVGTTFDAIPIHYFQLTDLTSMSTMISPRRSTSTSSWCFLSEIGIVRKQSANELTAVLSALKRFLGKYDVVTGVKFPCQISRRIDAFVALRDETAFDNFSNILSIRSLFSRNQVRDSSVEKGSSLKANFYAICFRLPVE